VETSICRLQDDLSKYYFLKWHFKGLIPGHFEKVNNWNMPLGMFLKGGKMWLTKHLLYL
jgi:hypothetical protein